MSLSFATPALAGKLNASALREGQTYDRFIVRFNADAPERSNAAARKQALDAAGRGNGVGINQLRRLAVGADVIRTDRKLDRVAAQQLMQRLANNPHVEYVELDAMLKPLLTPNDSQYTSQWHYFETTAGINLPAAWDQATATGIVVAVVDTGITPHADLTANMVAGYDFISDATAAGDGTGRDSNPNDQGDWVIADECNPGDPASDSSWHGTHVAGTVAAVTNNSAGVAGVAFGAKVSAIRVLGKCGGSTSDIADGIVWASGGTVAGVPANANPAEVINMSLGGTAACDFTSQAAIDAAVANGTVVVVAAGNENANVSTSNPANCNNVIAVAAVGRTGARASYSNYGSLVDVAAPGGDGADDILSTMNAGTTVQGAAIYAGSQGTSMASPHVAGVVALMQSVSARTPADVETILKDTARAFPVACALGCGAGIVDADAAITAVSGVPTLSIADVTLTEGNSGTKLATFTVTLSAASASAVTYNIATSNGTAAAGTDYLASSLTGQSIAAGLTSKTFAVTINGDATAEANETFVVTVTNVLGATIADGQALGTISNDDATALSKGVPITGISATIGQQRQYSMAVPTGATGLSFAITGSTGDADLYVRFGSAPTTSTFDCAPQLTASNETCNIATAQVGTYYVMLDAFAAYSGVALTGQYNLTPTLSIADVATTEGNSGTKLATFTVKLSQASASAVTYNIATANGTAAASGDYLFSVLSGQSIPAGQTSKTFAVTINGDIVSEANETFLVNLGAPAGATVADGQAIGTILNDDGPTLSIADISVTEGNSGTKLATFTVKLSQAAAVPVTYNIATANGSAIAGTDYVASSLTGQSIAAGVTSKTFTVTINGDTTVEPNDTFAVNLSSAVGATIADSQAIGYVTNDDGPTLSIADVSITEGNSGTKLATFTVKLSQAAAVPVTYNIATANGSAIAGTDYVASSLTGQSIAAGVTTKTFTVTINGDATIEANETYNVNLSSAVNATIADSQAIGTLLNDDGPTISIADVAVTEGNSGTRLATFTVLLSQAAAVPVTYNIGTINGTATAGIDYVASNLGGQSIPAGQLSKTFSVTINGDGTIEPNETYVVLASSAVGATLSDDRALGTISNDD